MVALDSVLRRRRRLVVSVWAVALLAALPFAAKQSDHLTGGGFQDEGSQSVNVQRAIQREFPGVHPATLAIILTPQPGARAGDIRTAARSVEAAASTVPDIRVPPAARRLAAASAGAVTSPAVVLPLDTSASEQGSIDVAKQLRARLGITAQGAGRAAGGRVAVHLGGQGALWAAFQDVTKQNVAASEARGFPAIAIVLLAVFGSLAAVALPLGLGFAAVAVTGAVVYALSLTMEMSIFVTNIASMLGIGVAVDYSLFVLARYREEVRAGQSHEDARTAALATSGVAVLFSGLTVIASLAGLVLVGSTALDSMAVGAIVVVAISMLAASTLLPALIAIFGRRVDRPGRVARALARRGAHPARRGFWLRWTSIVMRRPVVSLVAGVAILLTLAFPALDLHMQNSAAGQLDQRNETIQGLAAATRVVGPGTLGPARVLVRFRKSTALARVNRATLAAIARALGRDPAVAQVAAPIISRDGRSALLSASFRADPESAPARAAVLRLRRVLSGTGGTRALVEVGGTTAIILDFDNLVSGSLWRLILFVLALSFLVLLTLLRSLVLPLKAVLMNVLSIAAAYGAMVAVFQWGWLSFLGLAKGPYIDTITPPLVLAVAFGLSMDYEVFLLSRIKERFIATNDNRQAVAEGLATSARTITSAALIMVIVFLAFVSAGMPSVQRLGFATAVAIAVDATIVRLVIVPAAMELLGEWNWWLPGPLARLLPSVSLEQARIGRPRRAAARASAVVPEVDAH